MKGFLVGYGIFLVLDPGKKDGLFRTKREDPNDLVSRMWTHEGMKPHLVVGDFSVRYGWRSFRSDRTAETEIFLFRNACNVKVVARLHLGQAAFPFSKRFRLKSGCS